MIVTIRSPFMPSFFKQKLMVDKKRVGYLKRANFFHMVIGHESYQVKYKDNIVKLIEEKEMLGKQIWDLMKVEKDRAKSIGQLKMLSSSKDTLSRLHTEFELNLNGDLYHIDKPLMKRSYCELHDDLGEKVATQLKIHPFKLKREIKIDDPSYSTLEIAIFILTLSIIVSVA